jgi:hypothetical protein
MRIKPLFQQLIILTQTAIIICLGALLASVVSEAAAAHKDQILAFGMRGHASTIIWSIALAVLPRFIMYGLAAAAIIWWLSQQNKILLAHDFGARAVNIGRYRTLALIVSTTVLASVTLVLILVVVQKSSRVKHSPTLGFNRSSGGSLIDMNALATSERSVALEPSEVEFAQPTPTPVTPPTGYVLETRREPDPFDVAAAQQQLQKASLMRDFLDSFRDSSDCNGITFLMGTNIKPDFVAGISVDGYGTEWIWAVKDTKKKGIGNLGKQSSARLAASDICLAVWNRVDPNHFNKPGGKVQQQ